MAPRILFEKELEQLKSRVMDMQEHVEISYDRLLLAVKGEDREVLTELLDNDRRMIDMQREIEAGCLFLLTKEQPVAGDMRLVSAVLKVVTDIERMGDHVADIAELYLREQEIAKKGQAVNGLLAEMMEETKKMIHEAVDAFVNGSKEAAKQVIEHDDVIDDMFNQVKECMMVAIKEQSLDADKVVDSLMIAKYLEKIGDHAVNIAEWAVFRITGDIQGIRLY